MNRKIACAAMIILLCLAAFRPALAAGAENAVPISDRAGLEAISNDPDGAYLLTADIDLAGEPWEPIGFSGDFDGGGHTIYNLTITAPDPQTAVSVDGNRKQYDTVFAALFSRAENARIANLNLRGASVDVSTEQNCFASCLVGYAENTEIVNCGVEGRVCLEASNIMCGVAGLVGFGYGTVRDSSADVTLTLVDSDNGIKCEQFMGGVLGTGYVNIENCDVTLRGFASVFGYVHNGGIVGMYYVHTDDFAHNGYVRNCAVSAVIDFFECNPDRRAYCAPVIGERLHGYIEESGNTVLLFENNETWDYSKTLLPEMCASPDYTTEEKLPNCAEAGYTTHTCRGCGYSYISDYRLPEHSPGEWAVLRDPTPSENGLRERKCSVCGEFMGSEVMEYSVVDDIGDTEAATATADIKSDITGARDEQPDSRAHLTLILALAALVVVLIFIRIFKTGRNSR